MHASYFCASSPKSLHAKELVVRLLGTVNLVLPFIDMTITDATKEDVSNITCACHAVLAKKTPNGLHDISMNFAQ